MPKFYCEYCDIYLTHSSPAGRRQHTTGRKHINAKVEYFQNLIRHPDFRPPEYIMQLGPAILEKGTSNPYIGMQQTTRERERGGWRGGRGGPRPGGFGGGRGGGMMGGMRDGGPMGGARQAR